MQLLVDGLSDASGSQESSPSDSRDAALTALIPPISLTRRFLRPGPRPGMPSSTEAVILLPRRLRW